MKGLVIKNTGSWYSVKTDDGPLVECKIKGNFRLRGIRSTNPVADNSTAAGRQQNRRVEIYMYASQAMIQAAENGTLK